jgi:glutamate-1-semialdehyde 2,1-aminomutase
LIFDEVISGFRLGRDGAAGLFEDHPDLATSARSSAAGCPSGASAARAMMARLARRGYLPGRHRLGDPVAMTAGLATLSRSSAQWAGSA